MPPVYPTIIRRRPFSPEASPWQPSRSSSPCTRASRSWTSPVPRRSSRARRARNWCSPRPAAGRWLRTAASSCSPTSRRWRRSRSARRSVCPAASGPRRRWRTRSIWRACNAWPRRPATLRPCATGSRLLGAAGLLRVAAVPPATGPSGGELLPLFGAILDPARVVRDGNLITGGGVTAGIDMALTVMAEIAGRDFAEAVQLGIEYAPQPPFAFAARRRMRARGSCSRLPADGSMRSGRTGLPPAPRRSGAERGALLRACETLRGGGGVWIRLPHP